jgi:uncharacterized membrane protein
MSNNEILLERSLEGVAEQNSFLDEKVRGEKLANNRTESELKLRKKYAKKSFYFACVWLAFLIILTGCQFFFRSQTIGLKESEFIAVSTTTTGAVFGFWAIVLRYFFPSLAKKL